MLNISPHTRGGSESAPLVSIVLPTYKRAGLLGYAIRSVLAQTCSSLELIVVDDNSPDNTEEVVRSFSDKRIQYIRNRTNLKLPGALNEGFMRARGRFMTWTSDDNLYAANALERMVEVLEREGYDFVYADYFQFEHHEPGTGLPIAPVRVRLPALRLHEGNSVGACFLYSRAVFEGIGLYDQDLFLVEDYDYFIRTEASGFRIRHIPEPLYYFSRHDDALFCSRFAEVQAAGVLVRYKNRLLDQEKAVTECVRIVTNDMNALSSPVLRGTYRVVHSKSYRLTRAYERFVRFHVERKIGKGVRNVLDSFAQRAVTFSQAKEALRELLLGVANLEYR